MTISVLVVDDEPSFRELYARVLREAGFTPITAASAEEAEALLDDAPPAMIVSDVRMPGEDGLALLQYTRERHPHLPFLLVTAYASVRDAVSAPKLGAVDYLQKPIDLEELICAVREGLGLGHEHPIDLPAEALTGIVAESSSLRAVLRDALHVAATQATVLLTGESGAGKDIVATFIHRQSDRAKGPLVSVNCAAIPGQLLASELFGHEKGAFTGAMAKRGGRFREADGGTLFLDEIGDMPLDLQPALLRVLETNRIAPVGSDQEIAVNYRLIAATNRDLHADVTAGRFREDLYYRLNVIALEIPSLRERPEDILPLARHFLNLGEEEPKRLSQAAARVLAAHEWPGNVRELANAMERARILSRTAVILPEHLPPTMLKAVGDTSTLPSALTITERVAAHQTLEEQEIQAIRDALAATNGNRTHAATRLGISRRGLIKKLKRFGIQ